jgi:hypothetical protein
VNPGLIENSCSYSSRSVTSGKALPFFFFFKVLMFFGFCFVCGPGG